jgi:hypothetical protein
MFVYKGWKYVTLSRTFYSVLVRYGAMTSKVRMGGVGVITPT